jgi:uncharacterized repeat protein (TIGR01451 family)
VKFTLAAAAAVTVVLTTLAPAHAVTIPSGPAGSADAYGLLVDTSLVNSSIPAVLGPRARATQDYPPGATSPATAHELAAGPVPADSSLVDHVGVMDSIAGANGAPNAVASSQVADVSLLGAGNNAKITADLVRAQANSDCVNAPNATGTQFVNLVVNGTPVSNTPAPNTVIPVPTVSPVLIVIVNEQVPANDGRGIVVNALHVISTTAGNALFQGDIIVSHAMSTVHCTNGAGSTGSSNTVTMTKSATPSTAKAGDTVTYDAAVTNHGSTACLVNAFIEHLSPAFDLTATSGDFGTAVDKTLTRPGGGSDLYLGKGKNLAAGATFHQQFTVTVKAGTTPGVYYNNLELLCANIGEFVKGLDAPVRVVDDTTTPVDDTKKPQCSDGKDNDGDGKVDFGTDPGCASPQDDDERDDSGQLPRTGGNDALFLLGGTVLIALAAGTRRLRNLV